MVGQARRRPRATGREGRDSTMVAAGAPPGAPTVTATPARKPSPSPGRHFRQADPTPRVRGTAARRRRAWLVGGLLVAALTGAHLVLGAFMRVPIIHPDEL